VLDEIDATETIGIRLADRVAEIFSRNQITPSIALQELQQLQAEARSLAESLAGITTSFAKLGIGKEDLEAGECELGVLVPRLFVDNLLGNFADELKDIDRILGVFSELTLGSRPGFEIKTISSSDLSVFLQLTPFVAAAVATAIERIVALYKNLLEVRRLQGQLAEQGVSKENLSGLENHANTIMTQGIEKLAKEIIKEHKSNVDPGRKNELSIELRLVLNQIATRIDRGFNIEVRMAEPERASEQDGTSDAETDKLFEQYAKIQDATKSMQFLRLEGEPILRLTDGKSKPDNPGIE